MRLLVPHRDIERYLRNTAIYEDYRKMQVSEEHLSENQKHTRLAAQYDLSVTMVRKMLDTYMRDYPLSQDLSTSYLTANTDE